jgi:hypothetical protein
MNSIGDPSRPGGYERSDANPKLIVALAVGTAIFLLAVPLALHVAYGKTDWGTPAHLPLPSAPRLQVQPKDDLERLRTREDALLEGYGWKNGSKTIAHIPIDDAMRIIATRGLPGWPSPAPGSPAPARPDASH